MTPTTRRPRPVIHGFTLMELLVAIAIGMALATITITVVGQMKQRANMVRATEKIHSLGVALVGYTGDTNGLLPYEDAPGTDDWNTASKPENSEVWYNALPERMGYQTVGDMVDKPDLFYEESYPLYVPGAPYPKGDKKFKKPYFAIGMNSRLQRSDDEGRKEQGTLQSIQDPTRTVAFLERGMPGDKKVSGAQRGFSGKPKANPRGFATRHKQKGILLFVDGHTEVYSVTDLVDPSGEIPWNPQRPVVWTRNPKDDPN